MTRVNLPPGCMGFKADDGTRYVAKPGTHVDVADHHMAALKNQTYASAGLVDAGPEKQFIRDPRKQGRWCMTCNKLWHGWKRECCGQPTVLESEMELRKVTLTDMFPEFAPVMTEPGSESGGTDPGSLAD